MKVAGPAGRAMRVRFLTALLLLSVLAAACGSGGPGGSGGSGTPARPTVAVLNAAGAPSAACAGGAGAVGAAAPPAAVAGGSTAPAPREPFLTDPASQAAGEAGANPAHAGLIQPLVRTPTAFPVGDWLTDVTAAVRQRGEAARAAGATAVFMVYAIPHRDAGAGFSAGGAADAAAYRAFTRQVAAGIGAGHAVVILEPDSLGQLDNLDPALQEERYQLLNDAVDVYAGLGGTSVYLDGANCGWTAPATIAERLLRAGVARARGFAVNVSNYYRTEDEVARGTAISGLTGNSHFVVDTSRNGRGPADGLANAWCNPPGRGLGQAPTTATGNPLADAFLWIKTPGASDGECGRGNPPAGTWWPAQAEELVRNAA
ncbi:endoglucanase [Parafrankia colletiae]|uniref:Glucanase n=1 Tax=Parafrankia colletiae TaxID=573497 RepID=A0A1S1QSS7_9ACTN|nr:glycoside hydrolase family 6 protein [Parafrankia colletiae]MCK9903046.1 glycoside hydrolase family 6 protein [Frankia sp. Cpl3]OHV35444.1 endoglucanase [Parafrankia colletiae]